ncbi:hypothetical protein ACLB1E_21915 [Escherichia coli]
MLTKGFFYLPLVFMPEADSLKHPLQFYLTLLFPQTVFIPERQIEYTTSATASAIPTVVNASGQVIDSPPAQYF